MSSREDLTSFALGWRAPSDEIVRRQREVHRDALAHSRFLHVAQFTAIDPSDLGWLFEAYDARFFERRLRGALGARPLQFRLSRRFTISAGRTERIRDRAGNERFGIVVGSSILFDQFRESDRMAEVCGIPCADRLEALQRVFEHELIHLLEHLCWERSECSARRFQEIAGRFFLHRTHTHNLITRRERAANAGIRIGSRVAFSFGGRRLAGRVNRVTRRATVLVEDPEGELYSNGLRYKTYYVPLAILESDPGALS